jgi:HEAT repeat protein
MNKLEKLKSLKNLEDIQNYLKNLTLNEEEIRHFFYKVLPEKDSAEQLFFLKNMVWTNDPFITNELKIFIQEKADSKLKASWVKSVPLKYKPGFIPFIAKFLRDDDNRVRANTVEALSIFGSEKLKEILLPMIKDPDNRTKSNTLIALWKYEELREYIKKTFAEMLSDESRWMRASAFYAFGEIGLEEFTDECIKALNDKDEIIAKNAILALISYAENSLNTDNYKENEKKDSVS